MINISQNSDFLQLHYYLADKSHSMNALVFNKAESEVLKMVGEISKILQVEVITETQALEEGGIKAIYKFLNRKTNKNTTKLVSTFFAGIMATIIADVTSDAIKTDKEFEQLKKQEIRLNIEKLKKELEEGGDNDVDTVKIVNNISIYLGDVNKVKLLKSNFYTNVLKDTKVKKISTQQFDENFTPVTNEKIVTRQDFSKHIISSADIEDDYQNQIALEIVSPVLRTNKLKWKAIYNDKNISFTLKDKFFKSLIISKNLSFSNGTKLVCDLETRQKMNSEGEIIDGTRSVYNVSGVIYSDGTKIDIGGK